MPELQKVLSFPAILLITINSIMGTGIFFLPAVGAKTSGPASLLAWLILSIVSIYIAMCFGELSSMFPKAGGIYEFCKQAYGRFFSFIIGWLTVIAGNVTIAMLVVGAVQYLAPYSSVFMKITASLLFVFIFNYIAFKGMKTSAVMLVTFAFITLATLFLLIIPGIFKFKFGNFTPFFVSPPSTILLTIFLIAETFFGWETATFLAGETKNGQKVMPKALIYGTVIIAIISLFFVVTSLGSIRWDIFGISNAPLTDLGILHYGLFGGDVMAILVYLAIIGSVAGWVVSAPRLLLAMAKDKLFLTQFSKIHHKNLTPHRAIIFQTVLTTILVIVGAGSYTTLLHLLVPIVLIAYSFVLVSLVVLRYKMPNQKRYFTVPFGKVGPIIIALFMLFLIGMWVTHTPGSFHILKLAFSLLFAGIPIYLLLEMYYDESAIGNINSKLAFGGVLFENIIQPPKLLKEIIFELGNVQGKKILEYGCTVGTLTKKLSKRVLPDGTIYAFDTQKHNLKIAAKRLLGHNHIKLFHHNHLTHFHTSQKIPLVDVVVSSGALSYTQKPGAVLMHIGQKVKKGGKIVFVDYDRFFHIIPNVPWISDEKKLKGMFRKAGFNVDIHKKRGFLWTYIFIIGRKV